MGTVRFNVAGNAANGDGTNQGDYIFTNVYKIAAAAAPPPPPPPDLTTHAFTTADRGGASISTDGSGAQAAGYSRIVPDSGMTTPTGVAIFGFRNNNVLVSETGVPATPLVTAGRIYAEVNIPINTGIAIANPNSTPVTISFNFTDQNGNDFGQSNFTLAANAQIARFLSDAPFRWALSRAPRFRRFSNHKLRWTQSLLYTENYEPGERPPGRSSSRRGPDNRRPVHFGRSELAGFFFFPKLIR